MKQILKLSTVCMFALLATACASDDDSNDTTEPEVITVTDADGNVYNTITIGNQTWMLENLKTTKYNDGTPITKWEFGMDWASLPDEEGFYQWALTADLNNIIDEELPFDYYGAMYNHFAIESGKLAPDGWRIPTEQDFRQLENYLRSNGFSGNVAEALKSDSGWSAFSGNGTNASGFNGLPNGYVAAGGTATASETVCSWGTIDVESGPINSSTKRKWVQLGDEDSEIFYSETSIILGVGIRCIKE
ncbi:fibrobacter succinogenes major paralogous domain-containing protein [Kordia jejudonensis]|uniref:fibrobacter succinogenes major paralogous domain-containing protein n=1 Tax=Kordia jejudonensis TaxID=1348245 RepID=UPI00138DFC6F|nr:fibrobacter succinogenes major paralogous domain-containing protein [Kordia jejudonensis]